MDSRRCHLCREWSDDLEAHLAEYHLKWFPFECARCLRRLPTDAAVRKHTAKQHVGFTAKYCYESGEDRKPQLDALVAEALHWNSSRPRQMPDRPGAADTADAALNLTHFTFTPPPPISSEYQQLQPNLLEADGIVSITCKPCSSSARATPAATARISVVKLSGVSAGQVTPPAIAEVGVHSVADSPALKRRCVSRASPALGLQSEAIVCKVCADWKVDRLGTRSTDHVYMHLHNQLGEARFKCTTDGRCQFTTPYTAIIKRHAVKHVGETFTYEDRETLILPQAEEMHRQCFGKGLQSSFAAHTGLVWCLLCKQGVTRNVISRHVYEKHMPGVAIYKCSLCEFGSPRCKTVRGHMRSSHPKAPSKPVLQSDMFHEEIKAAYRRCFDSTVYAASGRTRSAPIGGAHLSSVCKMCGELVETNRFQHVYQHHQDELIFKCPACIYGSKYSISSVITHMSSIHGLARAQLVDLRMEDECAGRLHKLFADCFYETQRE